MGICRQLIGWIADFLIGRGMRVSVSGIRSDFMDARGGVPQVRCCFFFLLISYLLMLFLNVSFFEDDVKIYLKIRHSMILILSTCHQIYLFFKEILILYLSWDIDTIFILGIATQC